ncbi:hypothetical protein GH5_02214 [Leishmania sp. Ghana 2012 LV757]|uniref:hypothetical protein n=1 Tax=Leishmania sp. Ghana 2012 LV757 TaxID=2803181 RepID=UPI001B4DE7C7|nr:hypothetical protein GH5_02214 [Leishmania sp. Ghana 2012 LV757]
MQQSQGATLSISSDAACAQPHRSERSVRESPTVVVISNGMSTTKARTVKEFFSFNPSGGCTWWAAALPALLMCCAFASIVVIGVRFSQRSAPAVLKLMSAQQCSFLSPLQPPVPFEAWMETCASAHRGYAYPCTSQVDCVVLGPRCAPAGVLSLLRCVDTGARADHHPVCAYPSLSPTDAPQLPGFCTKAGTSCAICVAESCQPTMPPHGLVGCPPTSACDLPSWKCSSL